MRTLRLIRAKICASGDPVEKKNIYLNLSKLGHKNSGYRLILSNLNMNLNHMKNTTHSLLFNNNNKNSTEYKVVMNVKSNNNNKKKNNVIETPLLNESKWTYLLALAIQLSPSQAWLIYQLIERACDLLYTIVDNNNNNNNCNIYITEPFIDEPTLNVIKLLKYALSSNCFSLTNPTWTQTICKSILYKYGEYSSSNNLPSLSLSPNSTALSLFDKEQGVNCIATSLIRNAINPLNDEDLDVDGGDEDDEEGNIDGAIVSDNVNEIIDKKNKKNRNNNNNNNKRKINTTDGVDLEDADGDDTMDGQGESETKENDADNVDSIAAHELAMAKAEAEYEAQKIKEEECIMKLSVASQRCYLVIKTLMSNAIAEQYNVPVDPSEMRYYKSLCAPLCLSDIRRHLVLGDYEGNFCIYFA
jgi:hypothetical protein